MLKSMKNLLNSMFLINSLHGLASATELLLRAERVSTHSNKSSHVFKLKNNPEIKNIYRTNSHHGLPKGSFLVPNPVHFHIAHEKQIALRRKPHLTSLTPFNCSSGYIFNHNRLRSNAKPVVTVNFDNTHSVSLNIPIEILRGFILPFASALNLTTLPTLNTQSSQTTYMNNFQRVRPNLSELSRNYTPLVLETSYADYLVPTDATTSFEAEILKKMHYGILDMSIDSNTSERESRSSSSYEEINADKSMCDFSLYSPTSKDEGKNEKNLNESGFTFILDVENATFGESDSGASSNCHFIYIKEELPFHNIDDIELDFLLKGKLSYSANFPENGYCSNMTSELSVSEEESIDEELENVLKNIEGLISNLPETLPKIRTDVLDAEPTEELEESTGELEEPTEEREEPTEEREEPTEEREVVQRVLWRISEASNEDKQSTITQISEVMSEDDIKNETFIVDDVRELEEMFETFDRDEENRKTDSGQRDFGIPMDATGDNEAPIDYPDAEDAQISSEDEGIEDMTPQRFEKSSSSKEDKSVDDRVKKLSEVIYEYLREQCFEIREIVLFPEVLHDPNLNKVLVKLKTMYDDFYSDKLSNEEKNTLRLSMSSHILNRLEVDENINNVSNDSSLLSIISDKIFSLTEFVSDILDNFFNLINCLVVKEDSNGENFLEFTKPFRDTNGNVLHSTPESPLNVSETSNTPSPPEVKTPQSILEVPVVTSFKKNTSKKSGAETFWISCHTTPEDDRAAERTPRRFINVDDIPLRPPADLLNVSSSDKTLYSIKEEPRCNLFKTYDEEADSDELRNPYFSETVVDDVLAGGDGSYLNFDKPEVNVVLHNAVKFYRIASIDSISYVRADSVIIQKSDDSNDSFYSFEKCSVGSDDEGDWMGYEMAKF